MIDIRVSGRLNSTRQLNGLQFHDAAIIEIEDTTIIVENVNLFKELHSLKDKNVIAKLNPCSFIVFDGQHKQEVILSLEAIEEAI